MDDIEESQIVSNAAYNLFYARKDIDFENINYDEIKHELNTEKTGEQ